MRHLPKHLRPRWRYLAVGIEAWPDADFDRHAFQQAAWRAGRRLLGDPGSADADLRVVAFVAPPNCADGEGDPPDPTAETGTRADAAADAARPSAGEDRQETGALGEAVVRARRGEVDPSRAALACVDEIGGDPVGIRVRGVSGTVRACVEKHCPRLAARRSGQERYLTGEAGRFWQRGVVFEDSRHLAFARGDAVDVRTEAGFVGATELDLE